MRIIAADAGKGSNRTITPTTASAAGRRRHAGENPVSLVLDIGKLGVYASAQPPACGGENLLPVQLIQGGGIPGAVFIESIAIQVPALCTGISSEFGQDYRPVGRMEAVSAEIHMPAFNVRYGWTEPAGSGIDQAARIQAPEHLITSGRIELSPTFIEDRPEDNAGRRIQPEDSLPEMLDKMILRRAA